METFLDDAGTFFGLTQPMLHRTRHIITAGGSIIKNGAYRIVIRMDSGVWRL